MARDLSRLARRAVLDLEPYEWEVSSEALAARHGLRVEDVLRFDLNTSPYPPRSWDQAVEEARVEAQPNEYFDTGYAELTPLLAAYCGVAPDQVVVGAGADELLDIVAKTFLDNGDAAVVSAPSYPMYPIVSRQLGAEVRRVPLRGDLVVDVDAVLAAAAGAKVIWHCEPNSPTATATAAADLRRLIEEAPCMVVVDEAYAEFAGRTALPLVAGHPNLVVVRTMSKAFGMAGMRLGWAVAQPAGVELMNRVRPPNSVSYVTARVGAAALRDAGSMREHVGRIVAARAPLADALGELGAHVHPSVTNFLLTRWQSPTEAGALADFLRGRGIVVRDYSSHALLPGHLRVTVRSPEQNARLLAAVTDWRRRA